MKKLDENCILLGYYAASSSNSYPTFRNNLMRPLKMGRIGRPQLSLRNYHYPLRNNPEERSYVVGKGERLLDRGPNMAARDAVIRAKAI